MDAMPKEKNMKKHLKPKYVRYKTLTKFKTNTVEKLEKHIKKFPEDAQACETLKRMKSGEHRFDHSRR